MKWFAETFLPSLYERRKMYHGKIATFLTERQANICRKYMSERICYSDYGQFGIFEGQYDNKKIQLCEVGKYEVLYW